MPHLGRRPLTSREVRAVLTWLETSSQTEGAAAAGISRPTMSRLLRHPDARRLIERYHTALVDERVRLAAYEPFRAVLEGALAAGATEGRAPRRRAP